MGRWLLILGLLLGCWGVAEAGRKPYKTLEAVNPEKIRHPEGSPSAPLVELGRTLFFDPRLSGDGSQSCSSCHAPERGFSDGRQLAQGMGGLRCHVTPRPSTTSPGAPPSCGTGARCPWRSRR